jgi:fimbrial chaperone protein
MFLGTSYGKRPLHIVVLSDMIRTMKKHKILIVAIWLMVFFTIPIFAFQFSPLEQEFAPSGANSTKTYTIVNDSNDTIAVEITALTRDLDVDGKEINETAAAYFSIVPSKVLMRPQSSQIVRVQYRGPRTVPSELAFRLRAEQLTYTQGRADAGQSMFNFLYVYTTSLYVTPSRSVVRVVVDSAVPIVTSDGRNMMSLTVSNTGTTHQLLNGVSIEVSNTSTRQSVVYEGDALGFVNGLNLLAGKTVTVLVAWPESIPFPSNPRDAAKSYTAKINYNR